MPLLSTLCVCEHVELSSCLTHMMFSQTFRRLAREIRKEIDFQCASYVCLLLYEQAFRHLNCFLYLKRGVGSLMFMKVLSLRHLTTISFTNFTHSQAKDCIHPGLLDSNQYLCYEEKIMQFFLVFLSMLSLLLCTHCDKKCCSYQLERFNQVVYAYQSRRLCSFSKLSENEKEFLFKFFIIRLN